MNKPQKIVNHEEQNRVAQIPGNGASRLASPETNLVGNDVEMKSGLKVTSREPRKDGHLSALFSGRPLSPEKQLRSTADFPLITDQTDAVASEAFSILRSRLLSVQKKAAVQTVLITSAEANDGKTVVSVNLALSLGELGSNRVLLVDGDLRTGTATKILRMKHLSGLGDFLQGSAAFEDVVSPTEIPSLFVVPAGGIVMKKVLSELLQGPRWSEFLQHARQKFDLIVVDSLPYSAPVADLELMSAFCDAALLVVCIRRTSSDAIRRAAQKMDPNKFLGIVINNAAEIYDYDYGYLNVKSSK